MLIWWNISASYNDALWLSPVRAVSGTEWRFWTRTRTCCGSLNLTAGLEKSGDLPGRDGMCGCGQKSALTFLPGKAEGKWFMVSLHWGVKEYYSQKTQNLVKTRISVIFCNEKNQQHVECVLGHITGSLIRLEVTFTGGPPLQMEENMIQCPLGCCYIWANVMKCPNRCLPMQKMRCIAL